MTTATIARKTVAAEKRVSSVVIVARYTFKDEARKAYSVYVVRSSDGSTTYTCTLVNGKATGCDCPARKPCKHETACERAEVRILAQKARHAEELAAAAQVAPMVLGNQFNSDLGAHIDDELSVLVFMDHDGHYGRVRVDGKIEELPMSEIRERFPRFKVVSGEEFYESEQQAAWAVLSKERQRQLYSELYPDDYGYVA